MGLLNLTKKTQTNLKVWKLDIHSRWKTNKTQDETHEGEKKCLKQKGSIKDRHDTGEKAERTKVTTWPGYTLMSLAILYRENVEVWRACGAFKFMSFRERKSRDKAGKASQVSFCVWALCQLKISLLPQTQSWWWWKEATVECNSWSSPEYPPLPTSCLSPAEHLSCSSATINRKQEAHAAVSWGDLTAIKAKGPD